MSTTLGRRLVRRSGVALAGLVASTVVLLPVQAQAAGTPNHVILTPTSTPAVSQNISFRASEAGASKGIVEYRKKGSTAVQAVETENGIGYWGYQHHSATLASLSPATTYEYRVGSRLAVPTSKFAYSGWTSFTTATAGGKDFSFTVFGDTDQSGSDNSRWKGLVAQARAKASNSVLSVHTGDQVKDTNSHRDWNAWISGLGTAAGTTNAFTTVGHAEAYDPYIKSYKLKVTNPATSPQDFEESTWYADYQNVRFIALDTTGSAAKVKEQATWLNSVLSSNPSRWTVVQLHNGAFTAATSATSGDDKAAQVRSHILPLLTSHNVDLVLSGHEGTYSRGVLDTKTDPNNGANSGPLFVTNNSGGADGTLAPTATNGFAANQATALSLGQKMDTYTVVDVTTKGLSVSTKVASVRPGASAQQATWNKVTNKWDYTSVDTNELVSGADLDTVDVYKTADGTQKAVVEEGGTVPDFIKDDTSKPQPENPGTSNPTPGTKPTTPGGTASAKKTKAKIKAKKMVFKKNKRVVVKVRSNVKGTAHVKIKVGKKTWVKKVKVKANKWTTVKFKKKQKFTKKSPRVAKVKLAIKPAKNKNVAKRTGKTKWKKVRIKR